MTAEKNTEKLRELLQELNQWDALEFWPVACRGRQNFYLPYMMNDALEYYIIFKDCSITGEFSKNFQEHAFAELTESADRLGLIVREGNSHVFTLWFCDFEIVCQCFQYHRIGHFWVQGQEQWRQLVYMIGTMLDKQEYVGASVCNDKERALLPLMEFAPFYLWFPLTELPRDKYSNTKKGCQCMHALAVEAQDRRFAALVRLYSYFPFRWMTALVGHALQKPARQSLYHLIFRKVSEASLAYPPRDYGKEQNQRISRLRKDAAKKLRQKGFSGEYPFFQKDHLQIYATEEHPFTVMEADDFHFRIQFMVSSCACPGEGINRGFFTCRANEGLIFRDLNFLEE